jgi:hypothetical protein
MAGSGFGGLISPPASISPEPQFIAASAASQIVTNDHDSQSDTWFDQHGIEPSGETALVAPAAMKLVNRFLDQLLFNFLSTSKSVSLASLRPAVIEVLKPKLAQDAIHGADQELNEYLGGGEDEELLAFHNGLEPTGEWDLELVWKRTRLRCMVYSSLGDMEEEDEDRYTEEGGLETPGTNRFSNASGVVSPAVAIFLTSILEFMGEQALIIAGRAAYHRLRSKHERDEYDGGSMGEIADRVVVNEMDVEKVAMDRTLGRLWRGWKKRIRSPTTSVSMARSFSRDSLRSRAHSRRGSSGETIVPTVEEIPSRRGSVTESMIHENAASIALPMSEDDVREIETPWLALYPDSDVEDDDAEANDDESKIKPRPSSMYIPRDVDDLSTSESPSTAAPVFLAAAGRKRSHSLPHFTFPTVKKSSNSLTEDSNDSLTDPKAKEETEEGAEEVNEVTESSTAHAETAEPEKAVEPTTENSKGVLAGVISGAVAIGAVAVAGITAVATGKTPETDDATDSEDEHVVVAAASRVSMNAPLDYDPDRAPSRASSVSVRPNSIHSVRVVDIAHSPTRSRKGSQSSMDSFTSRPIIHTRNSSPQTPSEYIRPLNEAQRTATASPIARTASAQSHKARQSSGSPMSEVEKREITSHPKLASIVVPERSPLRELETATPTMQDPVHGGKSEDSLKMSANTPYFGEPQFVLAAAPTTRGDRDTQIIQPKAVSPTLRSPDSGAPPLTPLREMMEGAPDTSDEASSIAPSLETEGNGIAPAPIHYRPYDGRRSPEQARSIPSANSPQRMRQSPRSSPQQLRRDDDTTPKPHAFAKTDRHTHTSGSSTSSGSHKVRPVRTSEDSHRNGSDKGKSFEELIQSDQTIQYTLTPQNMRELDVSKLLHQNRKPY